MGYSNNEKIDENNGLRNIPYHIKGGLKRTPIMPAHPVLTYIESNKPIMFDLTSDSDCSSDTNIARETEGLLICCMEL